MSQSRFSVRKSTIIVLLLCFVARAGDLFSELSFEDACKKAKSENKLVFIDFYTTWCGPCKAMEKTVFADAGVIEWMTSQAICLKLDGDKNKPLVSRYMIVSYPTMLFLKPDGTVAARINHAIMDTATFLHDAKEKVAEARKTPVQKATEEWKKRGENDPLSRFMHANRLRELGELPMATEHFTWCFDKGPSLQPGFAPALIWYSAQHLAEIAETYPPAKDVLKKRYDTSREAIDNAKGPEDLERYAIMRFVYTANALGDPQAAMNQFDAMQKKQAPEKVVKLIFDYAFKDMVQARRYKDIESMMDFDQEIQEAIRKVKQYNFEQFKVTELQEWDQAQIAERITLFYQVLLGLEEYERAEKIAAEAMKLYDSPHTLNDLAWAGLMTGKPIPENIEQARKAVELTDGKEPEIIDTLARLLAETGQQKEACRVLTEAGKTVEDSPYTRLVMKTCATDIGCPDNEIKPEEKQAPVQSGDSGEKE